MKTLLFKYKEIFIVLTILLVGLFLRTYQLEQRTSFDADQEWLATRAYETTKGDFPLLGPVTSVGNFSIGPGYIYLLALFGLFTNNSPITGAYLSVTLGILFLIGLYCFSKFFIDKKLGYIILIIGSFSSNLIFWDQSPWAPSLFYLSQLILIAGAYLSSTNKFGYLLMSIGFVLGFQSHFGIVLSLISIFVYLIFVKPVKPNLAIGILSVFIVFIGLLPNIVFDFTHNFINFKRFLLILSGDGIDYFVSFNKIVNVLVSNTISHIFPRESNIVDIIIKKGLFALVLVNAIRLLRNKRFKKLSFLLLVTGILPAIMFYLQQGKFSEYYLLMTVPSLILLFGLLIFELRINSMILSVLVVISIVLNIKLIANRYVSWNLNAKQNIARTIIDVGGYDNYGISLNSKLGNQFGFKYIFDHFGIKANIPPKKGETRIFSVIIPQGFDGMVGTRSFDGIGLLWVGI